MLYNKNATISKILTLKVFISNGSNFFKKIEKLLDNNFLMCNNLFGYKNKFQNDKKYKT